MNFNNPDNRAKAATFFGTIIVAMWVVAVWIESPKIGWTGAIMLLPLIALIVWTVAAYDEETGAEAELRKQNKKDSYLRPNKVDA